MRFSAAPFELLNSFLSTTYSPTLQQPPQLVRASTWNTKAQHPVIVHCLCYADYRSRQLTILFISPSPSHCSLSQDSFVDEVCLNYIHS